MIKRTSKFLFLLLTAAMVFTMLPVSAFAEVNIITDTSLLKNADVNGDEKVNIADLIRLSRWLSGMVD